jgi:type II secretory pathway pseudopilin PulG
MGDDMKRKKNRKEKGFTLFEAVVGIALVAIAILGLAEMFTLSVLNNMRSDRITNAAFLAQQQVEIIRNLTLDELTSFASGTALDFNGDGTMDIFNDQLVDLNGDAKPDYRRITEVQPSGMLWEVDVLVFTQEKFNTDRAQLLANPQRNRVRARVSTILSR